ncbi:MAG: M20/M25/M40 family metallo-hydrolase [Woeseiaceae bacterium]|nr:M20/M25/M40 family metallo-hydrolase [Woeseiaceae bacterium]
MLNALADRVLDYVRDQDVLFVDLLRELVEAESPSAFPPVHRQARHVFMSALSELDYLVRETRMPRTPCHVYARPCERERVAATQLIVGHYDTVWPVGTIAERPFQVDGNIIRGPGVFDMKGGLAQLIIALRTLRELGLEPSVLPVIFVNADEEIGSRTSSRFIRMLARSADRALVLEPALGGEGSLKTERKGIGRFKVTVYGKAAHAGLEPDAGASAILELSHIIQKLFAMNDANKGITVNVGTVDGGIQPNVVAPHSSAVIDVRVPTIADGDRIEREIHSLKPEVPGVRLRIEGRIGRPSMESTPRNEALWAHAKDLGRQLGLNLTRARVGGGSDGNTTSQYTATLDGLGPVGDGAHAQHEYLYIDKTLERAALLVLLLMSPPVEAAETRKPL